MSPGSRADVLAERAIWLGRGGLKAANSITEIHFHLLKLLWLVVRL
jgi:hypothetical protein